MSDELLIRLFRRHFGNPTAALLRLDSHLATVQLPFDLKRQLRELTYPPQPGLPDGMPSRIQYFVPNSIGGTAQATPGDPLDPSFVRGGDGIGLNFGCPVRLLRALDALSQLQPVDQVDPKNGLRNPRQHLSTVEELLWLTVWKSLSSPRRGGQFKGMNGDVDWAFDSRGFPIFLEAKFRQSDWPRLTDGADFVLMGDGFLSNAVHKFPDPPQSPGLHVVGITAFDNITEEIAHLIGRELESAPQIHAVVVRSLAQMTHVLSLSIDVRDRVMDLLAVPSISDYPLNVGVTFDWDQRDQRVAKRKRESPPPPASRVVFDSIQPHGAFPFPIPERGLYRVTIPARGPDGEPHFQVVPKYIMPSLDTENPPSTASVGQPNEA